MRSYSLAKATAFSKNSISTHTVVGLCGKLRTRIFGRGHIGRMVSVMFSKKSSPCESGTCTTLPFASTTA